MAEKEHFKHTEIPEDDDSNKEKEDDQKTDLSLANKLKSASEIVENLPKVWKVLIELLSHQSVPESISEKVENPCYNVVETPKGPNLVLSVSKTFIRLKDLILEKKSLERETGRLKHLNTHLECRLQEQEKRLETVSHELSETWHVVGKLQKKHQLLHTQEKILRYELAQKRKLLTQLREQLEDSREKWQEARQRNSDTEKQWKLLRIEFASRKNTQADDCNNSVESGYSDDKECSSEDEPGYETDVSECNQKVTPADSVVEESNIADVIQEEIASIEGDDVVPEQKTEPIEENTLEAVLSAREERLIRLEGQCSSLVKQVTNTSSKSAAISNKLDALHEIYGNGRKTETDIQEGSNLDVTNVPSSSSSDVKAEEINEVQDEKSSSYSSTRDRPEEDSATSAEDHGASLDDLHINEDGQKN